MLQQRHQIAFEWIRYERLYVVFNDLPVQEAGQESQHLSSNGQVNATYIMTPMIVKRTTY